MFKNIPIRDDDKEISGCGLIGMINKAGERVPGDIIVQGMCNMRDRGNGLGAGYAAYGIYPEYKDFYALQIMFENRVALSRTEEFLREKIVITHQERIPTRKVKVITNPPILMRYFVKPRADLIKEESDDEHQALNIIEDNFMVDIVMHINTSIDGAFIFSSGKNMGAFKGVGYPEDIADFFKLEEYSAYIWTAHTRFPTNTPGWWGGAHPFTVLDWSIVHNGEISSYGINKRYIEMYGYQCTLLTDTEVIAYLLDYLIRKSGLSVEMACKVLAPPFWTEIERMNPEDKELNTAIRSVYGSALLNGPFAILIASSKGMIGLNDRVKLRPLVAATKGNWTYMGSEESAICAICPEPERIWTPRAGEPVIAEVNFDDK